VNRQTLDDLKRQIPLMGYLQAHDWHPARQLRRDRWMGLCPLHEDHQPSFSVDADTVDTKADSNELHHEYGFRLTHNDDVRTDYDAVIVAVSHKPYAEKDEAYFQSITSDNAVLVDIKGMYRGKMKDLQYWSL